MQDIKELTMDEQVELSGGNVEFSGWINEYCNNVGKALHDAFGCYKCGLHFF